MPAKKKRAPGGGRKPKGEYANRAASLTMRISAELKASLKRQAVQNRRSLSQEAERLLRDAMEFPKTFKKQWRDDHYYGLGRMVARLAWTVEIATGVADPFNSTRRTWMEDPFTAAALRAAIDIALGGLAPAGEIEPPAKVQARAEGHSKFLSPERAKFYQTPEGVGEIEAMSFLDQLRTYNRPPLEGPANTHYADIFYEMPTISEKLGLSPAGT
jgi:hypothetical protein